MLAPYFIEKQKKPNETTLESALGLSYEQFEEIEKLTSYLK